MTNEETSRNSGHIMSFISREHVTLEKLCLFNKIIAVYINWAHTNTENSQSAWVLYKLLEAMQRHNLFAIAFIIVYCLLHFLPLKCSVHIGGFPLKAVEPTEMP